ncbi:MAG: DUF5916 domain-containing protein, partial [Gemmatimonadaceae bacterium]
EGSDIFDFGAGSTSGGQLFYSRRIGRVPSLRAPTSASDLPDATTILGSGKLSGKIGGWSIGVLEAVTARETSRFMTAANTTEEFVVEPLSNYLVTRARRELRGGQSFVGGVLTGVNRDLSTAPLEATLHRSAYSGGMDFRHEWGKRTWVAFGDVEFSRVAGSTSAMIATQRRSNHFFQRPDADHLAVDSNATSLTGYAMNLAFARQAGTHWRGQAGAALTSPAYEVNDLGFAVRTDRRDVQGTVTYWENKPGKIWRRWSLGATARQERNFDWQPILQFGSLQFASLTPGYWTFTASTTRFFEAFDDRLTRGGPLAIRPAWTNSFARVGSDGRKPLTFLLLAQTNDYDFGGWNWNVAGNVGIKTSSRWNARIGPSISRLYTPAQFVTSVADPSYTQTFGRRYVFAPLHQTTVSLETRFNMTFTPRLSLETYAQPLLSSQDYGGARQFVAPRTFAFTPYTGQFPDLDFNVRSLRGNAVLRWEWRQGSTMYIAWQQSRSDVAPFGDFDFGRDRGALFRTRPDNIFVVKMNYWLNP